MWRVTLESDGARKQFVLWATATIGRRDDNTIVLDDAAASGHHACVVHENGAAVLKDLESTNGTTVNGKRVSRHRLAGGDVVTIGRHRLVFEQTAGELPAGEAVPEVLMSNPGETVFLDASKHQALLAMLREAQGDSPVAVGGPTLVAPAAVLRVLQGDPRDAEFSLDAETSIIGRSDGALLRLSGWFTPKVAVAIARSTDGYVATAMGGRTLINHQPLKGRWKLQHGDVLELKGLTVEFRLPQ